MKKLYLLLILIVLGQFGWAQTTTYSTPGSYVYTVPAGVTTVSVNVCGAQGGTYSSGTGGKGGQVVANIAVSAGQLLYVYVGAAGGNGNCSSGGSSAGGGEDGGGGGCSGGGSGGGAGSDIRTASGVLSSRLVVGGGGGGGNWSCSSQWAGGAGGYPNGGNGTGSCSSGTTGGTQTGVGSGSCYSGCGASGSGGAGGAGTYWGGGGGGGYYGGGGGSETSGGGGSSYFGGTGVTMLSNTSGFQTGAGLVTITPLCGSSISGGNVAFCAGSTQTLTPSAGGGTWTSSNTAVATVNSSGVVTGVSGGTVTITYTPSCGSTGNSTTTLTVNAAPAAPTGNAPIYVCGSLTLSESSGTGTWASSNTSVATVSPSSGTSTTVSGGSTAGVANITFTLTSSGCTVVTPVTVNTLPSITAGTNNLCVGATTTVSDGVSGGSWTSSNSSVATVNSSGLVSGISAGTVNITYTVSGGCFTTYPMTVNTQPGAVSNAGAVCGGTVPTTRTLTSSPAGGTWTSSNTSQATVSSSGVVTGVASGTPTITYTYPGGCFSTAQVTVNAVANISGLPTVCVGNTITLTDATPSGSWSSSSPSNATVGASSGVVTGIAIGSANITYAVSSISCSAFTTVGVTTPPSTYAVTGGGSYCSGGVGVHIGLNSSDPGTIYTIFNGATVAGTATGTGSAVDFGLFTASGTYTVIAGYGNPCNATQSGSATVSVNPLPTAYTVGGGGSYCSGGTGVNVTLSSSQIGVNYQLMLGSTPIGSPLVGTSGLLTFGPVTTAGTYTIVATNATTSCVNTMAGSAVVSISSLPTAYAMTGGGGYCLGGTGVHVGLAGSSVGTTYQLLISGSPVGSPLSGTGSALDFGLITVGGTYTVLATTTSTGCNASMSGSEVVTVNSLPTAFTVTGGGAYCLGGAGSIVNLAGSTVGVNYQLYTGGSPVGSPVAGTGASITFGPQTAAGAYTVVATNTTTGCTNNMTGSVSVSINPLPTVFTVTGGGGYCAGGSGVHVGLSGSVPGTTYSLYNGTTMVGALSGSGASLDFGSYTSAGTYSVTALTSSTGCNGNMSGTTTVTINPLPAVFTVGGGGSYCAGSTGVGITLSGSAIGINYQLFNGTTAMGSAVAGTGSSLAFPPQTAAGSYTIVGTNATTTCSNNMSGSAVVVINPTPTVYAVTGGGGYCTGGTGVHVGLAASNTGISYQLFNGGVAGTTLTGTGFALDYGLITTAGTYTVTATNTTTGCTSGMSGSAVVSINPLPTVYSVTGGGAYCAGGTGVNISVSNSTAGVNYQLMNGTTPVGSPVAGTGTTLGLGLQTAAGTYTVTAADATTGCSANMSGSATITINPLPTVFPVTGGGSYCSGGAGVHVGVGNSVVGTNYQLFNGLASVGTMAGTGSALDFGAQTSAGTYTVVATTSPAGCVANMTGSAVVSINPLPATNTVTGGGSYCAGGTGVSIGLNGSVIGVSYQLMNGTSPVGAPMVGTSLPLNFGLQTAGGTYTVVGSNMTTGCSAAMLGSTTVNVNPLPSLHNVTGGGNYCVGGTGVDITLDNSNTGTNYQLYNGTTAVGAALPGNTGFAVDFGNQTALGIYTVVATNTATGCSGSMTGSATVATYPLPVMYNVTGGGSYCSGGTGVNVGLSGSNSGVTYQLMNGSLPVTSLSGAGLPLSFGPQTTSGSYTVVATNTTTGCSANMNGSATVNINPLPALHSVTGGGDYCSGGAGLSIGIDGSDAGIVYQLFNGTPVGSPVAGSSSALDFGLQTAAGTYTVEAINPSTTCTNLMAGSASIVIDPLPTQYAVSGGGHYCSGGAGVDISMSASDPGTIYQLWRGTTMVGSALSGPGSLDFGSQTTAGTYTVIGTTSGTGCNNTMSNTVAVVIDPLPTAYAVTGGGAYCAGGTGVHVILTNSNTGVSYQILIGGVPTGPILAGTGMAIDFGPQTVAGTYQVQGTNNATLCTNLMSGSVNVVVNPLPVVYSVSSTSSTYCAGGTGVDIWLNSSDAGISYQLYNGTTTSGSPLAGTGSSIDFGNHLLAGSYRVVAVNNSTGCVDTMSSSVNVVVNALPTVYSVTGGGSYCSGGTGTHVGISGSNIGISYQLMLSGTPVGTPFAGTGGPIDFGPQTGTGVYTVVASNPATTCTNNMSGAATVAINPLPAVYTITGGGTYCAGGSGTPVGLSNSTLGVNYQLYAAGTASGAPVSGSGTSISFGNQTVAGTYTVVATNTITGCTNNMVGLVTVGINAAPAPYPVIGGGAYCSGGSGVSIGLGNSASGVSYQLMLGSSAVGSSMPGSGSAISFGPQTTAGTYTVVATNGTTGCTNTMSGSANITISPLPNVYSVMGGGNYCAGGAGVHVGISNSDLGVNYKLINGVSTLVTLPGTGSPLDFGLQTGTGTYTVQAVNATTGCTSFMSGSAVVTTTTPVVPTVSINSNHGDTICQGTFTTFTAAGVNGGSSPTYQWMVNGVMASASASYAYVPLNGDVVSVTMTSSAMCASPVNASNSMTMTVDANESPAVTVSVNPGTVVCQGTSVTFTANPTFGGSSPAYAWYVNGSYTVSTPSYTYTPVNGDRIFAVMTSNYHCALTNTATSSNVNMEVDQAVLPVVTITAHPGNTIAPGETVTLTATVLNGGPTPSFQWFVNGVAIPGATQPTFVSNTFNDGDSATCQVLSSGGCSGLLGFNSFYIHVRGVGVHPVTANSSDVKLVPNPNKGAFNIKGSFGTAINEEVSLEVTDMIGQTVYTGKVAVQNGEINSQVDLGKNIANGMYILNVRSSAGNFVFHVVVEQ